MQRIGKTHAYINHAINYMLFNRSEHKNYSEKENFFINYCQQIAETSGKIKVKTSKDFDNILEKVSEIEEKYQNFFKTHNWFSNIFLQLNLWNHPVNDAYRHSRRELAGRVAKGYRCHLLSLAFCKSLLKNSHHRSFLKQAIEMAVSDTQHRQNVKGLVWKITNQKGISSYLIGTMHQGTTNMAQAKGIQEAINQSEKFLTETGFIRKDIHPLHALMHTNRDKKFDFIIDHFVLLEAQMRNKEILALDNQNLRKKFVPKSETNNKCYHDLINLPSEKFFKSNCPKRVVSNIEKIIIEDINLSKIVPELNQLFLIQETNRWLTGQESFPDIIAPKSILTSFDMRSKSWLRSSYESYFSEKPLPGLIEQLQNAEKPICIAVGRGHCFGLGCEISLMEEFRKVGLEVNRYK